MYTSMRDKLFVMSMSIIVTQQKKYTNGPASKFIFEVILWNYSLRKSLLLFDNDR